MSNTFTYKNGELFAENTAVSELAEQHGTPLYIYSRTHLREQYGNLAQAMSEVSPLICYSIKANSNAAVIKTFLNEGAGLDIVSGGELFRALRAGADPSKIVFAGVGKTVEEIDYALKENILFFTVESEAEAVRISECAQALGVIGRIAFRVNPDVDPQTHKYVSTGKGESKFGLDLERTAHACASAAELPNIEIAGLHIHIGSQILSAQPFVDALAKLRDLCLDLKTKYSTFKYIDIGGGIGITYEPGQKPLSPGGFAESIIPMLKSLKLSVIMEPGRFLVGNAGIMVCRVQYIKDNAFKKFVIVDAAMNDLIRPALYGSYHEVVSVKETSDTIRGDLVGPVCESGDFIAQERDLPAVGEGDLLTIKSAGAYGFVMASNYNSRPRPAEIMVEGEESVVVRERETWEDLIRGEGVME
ncbi:diaminopimelate decarboxylase [Verrucomicrobiota bacterium]